MSNHEISTRAEQVSTRELPPNNLALEALQKGATTHEVSSHLTNHSAAKHLPGLELTADESKMAAKIEKDIKTGNVKDMQKDINSFHNHTDELRKVMGKVQRDEKKEGVYVVPTFGATDSNVQVFNKKGGYDMTFSTDPADGGPGVSKVKIDKNGNWENNLVGYIVDTKKVFNDITHGRAT